MPTLDQLFLLNLVLDGVLLFTLVRLRGGRAGLSVVLGALFGASLATLAALPGLSWAGAPPVEMAAAITMVGIVRRPRRMRMLLQDGLVLLVLAAALAGLSLLFEALLPPSAGLAPLVLGAAAFLGLGRVVESSMRRSRHGSVVREVEVEIGERRLRLRCLSDSGCMARDPMTGLPVMVAELRSLGPILPERLRSILLLPALAAAQEVAGASEDGDLQSRIRLVEVQTVGSGSEWLLGFRGTVRAQGAPASAVVLITPRRLSRRGTFEAIAPPEFWNLEEGNAS